MAQGHLDRLSSTDASFLINERRASHMHVGGITVFEGPPPAMDDFLDHIRGRLHLVPRYRQKLATPPLEAGRPVWVDDPSFNLEYHVRQTALPEPGDEHQLRLLAGRIFSQRLDRSKPLWETWVVEGLEDNRFALIAKTHHALIDGIAGVDLAQVLFDVTPVPQPVEVDGTEWQPRPEPSSAELVAAGLRGMVSGAAEVATRALSAATHPEEAVGRAREAVEGIGEVVWAGLNPAPDTPLNVDIGPHRRLAFVPNDLADFKRIKDALGGTVNDVVLAVTAGALRRWLQSRGVRTEGLELRGLVPVSIRTAEQRGQFGNRLAIMRGPLPVYVADPVARLRFVKEAMDGLKESKQAVGAEVLAGVNNFAPPTVLAQAARINFSTRLFNLIVTNVPGPQVPLYLLGRELLDLFPVAFLPENHALAVAIMSYNGRMNFGLLADYDAMPDLEQFGEMIDASLAELLDAAAIANGAVAESNGKSRVSSRARTSRPRTSSPATTEA
jgi:diacylglycerol O-acyltransferase / wax synthase